MAQRPWWTGDPRYELQSESPDLSGRDALARMIAQGRSDVRTNRPQQTMRATQPSEIPSYGQMSPKEQQEQTMMLLQMLGPEALQMFGAGMLERSALAKMPNIARARPESFGSIERTIAAEGAPGYNAQHKLNPPHLATERSAEVAPWVTHRADPDPPLVGFPYPRGSRPSSMQPGRVRGNEKMMGGLIETQPSQPGPITKIMRGPEMNEALSAGARTQVMQPESPTWITPRSEMPTQSMPPPRSPTTPQRPPSGGGGVAGGFNEHDAMMRAIQQEMEERIAMRGGSPTEMFQPEPQMMQQAPAMQSGGGNALGRQLGGLPPDVLLAALAALGVGGGTAAYGLGRTPNAPARTQPVAIQRPRAIQRIPTSTTSTTSGY